MGTPFESSGYTVRIATPPGTLSVAETCRRDLASAYVTLSGVMTSGPTRTLLDAVAVRPRASVTLTLNVRVDGTGVAAASVTLRVLPAPVMVPGVPAVCVNV